MVSWLQLVSGHVVEVQEVGFKNKFGTDRRVVGLQRSRFYLAMLLHAWNHYQIVSAVSSSGVVVTLERNILRLTCNCN